DRPLLPRTIGRSSGRPTARDVRAWVRPHRHGDGARDARSPVGGRTDDVLIVRGINVFPSQVESVVVQFPELSPHYQLRITRERALDDLEVRIEADPSGNGGAAAGGGAALEARVAERLRGVVGIHIRVSVVPPGSLPRSEGGKLRRVIDERTS